MLSMLFSMSALRDWAKLLILGSFFETCRRLLSSLWRSTIDSFFITASFEEDDTSYQWVMLWLSKQQSWGQARNVQISTSSFGLNSPAHIVPGEETDHLDNSRKLAYLPAISESYTMWYKRHWMRVTRVNENTGWQGQKFETLQLRILARNNSILNNILLDAKKDYTAAQSNCITVHVSDSNNCWRQLAVRPKRPLQSIILDPGIQDLVVGDARDFLASKNWYSDRGIPFRRGYLLYGAPGSGKTSLIHAIAAELDLDVYIVSLSRSNLDDTGLSELIADLPEKCIALMEDIDAAFHHGLSRESNDPSGSLSSDSGKSDTQAPLVYSPGAPPAPSPSRVSLSGLLNALDGIGAQEGRILFATTNKYSALDPALCRPGRMDLHIEFKLASKYQAEELFKRFYLPSPSELAANTDTPIDDCNSDASSVDSGYADVQNDLIDLGSTGVVSVQATPSQSIPSDAEKLQASRPAFAGTSHRQRGPKLANKRIIMLAADFAAIIPDRQLSMAALQGYLMTHKTTPVEAVRDVSAWVAKELEEKERR
ncbi:P-loop containing nucleoside triphosphate hydrolase protein [Hygrophoropsis aurantiaca]|uniref:P-loop containing nucleoside triphosphate hydrolase protein n=1 Tax=Hygrophoropsis aurantiaca TaxID=72124 RepID=A0ACB8ASC2_9AGAM|nr:P-loop containing nucleoside triphosphate hydrolase protein [Hygrophoropsis aurantiaca]